MKDAIEALEGAVRRSERMATTSRNSARRAAASTSAKHFVEGYVLDAEAHDRRATEYRAAIEVLRQHATEAKG